MPSKKTSRYLRQFTRIFKTNLFFVFLSSFFLILSFPPYSLSAFAWIALIPFLWATHHAISARQALSYGALLGVLFFGVTISWLNYVHPFAWIALVLLEALFFMLIAVAFYYGKSITESGLRLVWIPVAWVGVEVLRSEAPLLGCGWNLIAYSQADVSLIRQFSSVFGAYGLSFVIVLINAILFYLVTLWHWQLSRGKWRYVLKRVLSVEHINETCKLSIGVVLCFLLLVVYGKIHSTRLPDASVSATMSVIQGNIPQDVKWSAFARQKILKIYSGLTEIAAKEFPHLIVWPEAAYPGYFNREEDGRVLERHIRELNVPVLIGSPHLQKRDVAYNSAYLVTPERGIQERYDKQFLVPFGEYVPLKPFLSFLEPIAYTLGVSDFTAGKERTVFHLDRLNLSFSTLICFEDVFAHLARGFLSAGADFLVVMTNDAWFGPSAAAAQHLQASIFRAVENGVPIVRAANTGISGFIDRYGHIISRVQDRDGKDIFVTGYKTQNMDMAVQITPYRRGGWFFGYAILGWFFIGFFSLTMIHIRVVKRKQRIHEKKMALATGRPLPKKKRKIRKKVVRKGVKKKASGRTRLSLIALLLCVGFQGCIRFAGTAYYEKPSAEYEEYREVKSVGFDTDKLVSSE